MILDCHAREVQHEIELYKDEQGNATSFRRRFTAMCSVPTTAGHLVLADAYSVLILDVSSSPMPKQVRAFNINIDTIPVCLGDHSIRMEGCYIVGIAVDRQKRLLFPNHVTGTVTYHSLDNGEYLGCISYIDATNRRKAVIATHPPIDHPHLPLPMSVAISELNGNIAVTDGNKNMVYIFSEQGILIREATAPKSPHGLDFDGDGRIYISGISKIRVLSLDNNDDDDSTGTNSENMGNFAKESTNGGGLTLDSMKRQPWQVVVLDNGDILALEIKDRHSKVSWKLMIY